MMYRVYTALVAFMAFIVVSAAPVYASDLPDSFADIVEDAMPAVVNVSTTQTVAVTSDPLGFFSQQIPDGDGSLGGLPDLLEKFYGFRKKGEDNPKKERKATSLGSGFVVDSGGYIVTNNHVIENADEISVIFSDESSATAVVVGRDPKTDIALLKVEVDRKLPSIKWGDSDKARVGDWVIAIGNPFGLGGSVSAGIISARARDINAGPFDDFLQTDAAINRGNSGGPLFNIKGEVIGINTAIFSPSGGNVGIGFAVPTALSWPVIQQLKEYGKPQRGWLGVKIQTVSDEIAESLSMDKGKGALVVEVTPDSPASKAGLAAGDVILSFDGKDVSAMRKLPRIVAETKINKKVVVTAWRSGKESTFIVKVAELEETASQEPKKEDDAKPKTEPKGTTILGLTLSDLTSELRKRYQVAEDVKGLLVTKVQGASNANEKGLRSGDVIVSANQKAVASIPAFEAEVAALRKQKKSAILLLINRRGNAQFIAIDASETKTKE